MELYQELEQKWAEWNGLDPAGMVACSSGTAALHLALEVMHLPPGSEVIVPDLTMIAVPRAVTMAGLTPVFVDCDDTLNMNLNLVTEDLQDGAAAMAFVHTYGRQLDLGDIYLSRTKRNLMLVEDLAEAHGVRPHRLTDAACWSFYKNKIVAGEEGGAVWFRDPEHARLARQLRSLGFTDAHDFMHVPRGHNYRMSNAHAALVLDSLRRVKLSLENRWRQWEEYDLECPLEWRMGRPDAPWVFAFRVPGMKGWQQNEAVSTLKKKDIEARHCFKPSVLQPEYKHSKMVSRFGTFQMVQGEWTETRSVRAAQEVVYLPLSSYDVPCKLDAFDVVKRILDK